MIFAHQSYREYLKSQLANKIATNHRYSLRAFSKKLGMAHASLADVMIGKRNLSLSRAEVIAQKLDLNEKETQYFIHLVEYENATSKRLKNLALIKLNEIHPTTKFHYLDLDHFKMISEWHHHAVLVIADLNNFNATAEQIAKKLNLTEEQVESTVQRLKRMKLITVTKSGIIKRRSLIVRAQSKAPNEALRNYHRQMLQKGIESLETQTSQEKYIGTRTFAVDEEDLPKITEAAREFLNKINYIAEGSKRKNQVYHAITNVFRLSATAE